MVILRKLTTLINLFERALTDEKGLSHITRKGEKVYECFIHPTEDLMRLYHYGTLIAQHENDNLTYFYGESKSDADALNNLCEWCNVENRFTFRPVNGGFQELPR